MAPLQPSSSPQASTTSTSTAATSSNPTARRSSMLSPPTKIKQTHLNWTSSAKTASTPLKKYKLEKSNLGSDQSCSSTWLYFHYLDILIGPTLFKPPPLKAAFSPQFPQMTRTQTIVNNIRINIKKRLRSPAAMEEGEGDLWILLARVILGFGEVMRGWREGRRCKQWRLRSKE